MAEASGIVASQGGPVHLSSRGEPSPFENQYCEGVACLVHRPAAGSAELFSPEHAALLEVSGPPTACWELQLQLRFKVRPSGGLWCGFELRQGPLRLGGFLRFMANAVLKVAKSMAAQRGAHLRYVLGDDKFTEKPHMAVPIMAAYRMFRSESPVALPITWPGKKGTWHYSDGQWLSIERDPQFFDTSHYFTLIFNTANIDWHTWQIVNIPALGAININMFTGPQPAFSMMYDDGEGSDGSPGETTRQAVVERRRYFVEVEWPQPHARHAKEASAASATLAQDVHLATPQGSCIAECEPSAKDRLGAELHEQGTPDKQREGLLMRRTIVAL